ncbi:unnamed protein product, partial [Ectocarpus fasciculatus]
FSSRETRVTPIIIDIIHHHPPACLPACQLRGQISGNQQARRETQTQRCLRGSGTAAQQATHVQKEMGLGDPDNAVHLGEGGGEGSKGKVPPTKWPCRAQPKKHVARNRPFGHVNTTLSQRPKQKSRHFFARAGSLGWRRTILRFPAHRPCRTHHYFRLSSYDDGTRVTYVQMSGETNPSQPPIKIEDTARTFASLASFLRALRNKTHRSNSNSNS